MMHDRSTGKKQSTSRTGAGTVGNTLSLKQRNGNVTTKLEERLHKILAQSGFGSRRALEQRIVDGMFKLNGKIAHIGAAATAGDRIECDGKTFVASALIEPARLLIYNKPVGEITTRNDPEGRPTVFDNLPMPDGASRWITIGRLDINTSGLLLFTTDGDLANAMMHPSQEIEREYVCRIRPPEGQNNVSDETINQLQKDTILEDGPAKFDSISHIGSSDSHCWFKVTLREGRNKEVRRLWESQHCQVNRLKRIRYGIIELPRILLRGHTQELPVEKIKQLCQTLQLPILPEPKLTLLPVIGHRKTGKKTLLPSIQSSEVQNYYVNEHDSADESRALRRFDHIREESRGRRSRKQENLTVSGDAAGKQIGKPFKQRKSKHSSTLSGDTTTFHTWHLPSNGKQTQKRHKANTTSGRKGPSSTGNRTDVLLLPSDHLGNNRSINPYGKNTGNKPPHGKKPSNVRPKHHRNHHRP